MANKKTKVLIVGGGFGGIKAALGLAGTSEFDVTLLSDQENFRYYPALYRTATGGKTTAANIPLAEIFKDKSVSIRHGSAKKLDRAAKIIKTTDNKEYGYDKLILALGVVTNFFGIKGLQEYSHGIKSQEQAQRLREHIHQQLLDEGAPDLNYVVIGGGPTGVELAGELPAYIKFVMSKHGLKKRKIHVDLVEAAPRLVPRMPKDYSRAVARRLRRLGIKLHLNQTVQAETADELIVSGHPISSHTVVWTAGVTNHPFFGANKFMLTDRGRVKVDEYLQAEPDIYVIGDNADTEYTGMAQTALHDGKYVAEHLALESAGKHVRAYKPRRPVYVTPVGPGWAAVLWNNVHFYGRLGWMLRSAADLAGYKDYEPWWLAAEHWIAEYQAELYCETCARG